MLYKEYLNLKSNLEFELLYWVIVLHLKNPTSWIHFFIVLVN